MGGPLLGLIIKEFIRCVLAHATCTSARRDMQAEIMHSLRPLLLLLLFVLPCGALLLRLRPRRWWSLRVLL